MRTRPGKPANHCGAGLLRGPCDLRRRRLTARAAFRSNYRCATARKSQLQAGRRPTPGRANYLPGCNQLPRGRPTTLWCLRTTPGAQGNRAAGRPNSPALAQPDRNQAPNHPTGWLRRPQPAQTRSNLTPNLTQTWPNSDTIRSNPPNSTVSPTHRLCMIAPSFN